MVTEDGCLTLVDDQGQVWLPILPAKGVTAAPEGISFDGEVFEHEERVGLGGGEAGSLDSPTIPGPCNSIDQQWLTGSIEHLP